MSVPFSFEVGEKYLRRDGHIAVCTRTFNGDWAEMTSLAESGNYCVWPDGTRINTLCAQAKGDIVSVYKKPKVIDITKPVQTRDGKPVTQLVKFDTIQARKLFGVVEGGAVYAWKEDGRYGTTNHNLDLENVPERKLIITPLEFGDILPGDIVQVDNKNVFFVEAIVDDRVYLAGFEPYTFQSMANDSFQYSKDRGKTWRPCYKEIEA